VGLTSFRYRDLMMMMLGRWVSTDPIGYQASVNLYCFVANSAITGFDPYGLEPKKSTKKFAGGSADFVYDVYDKKNSTFAFMIGHVSTQFPATGDLKMTKEESDLRAEEAKKVNPMSGLGATKYVGMNVSFIAILDCGQNPNDYQWVQKWKRNSNSVVAFEQGKAPPSLTFPNGWQLDHSFDAGKLSFKDGPGFATALKQMDLNTDVIPDMAGGYTIRRPDLTAQEQQHLKLLHEYKTTIAFEFRTELQKSGVAVATFLWGFNVHPLSEAVAGKKGEFTYSGRVTPHEVK